MNTIDTSQIDLKYEECRLRDRNREKILLSSISEKGILDSLQGVLQMQEGRLILLDGFKRYRCAKKLGIDSVPYSLIGEDAASGIIHLIRTSNDKSLHLLEQAKLVDELRGFHQMSVSQIAAQLERSVGWVGMRMGLLKEMSPIIKKEIFSGKFPSRAFMYTLRHFTRVKKVPQSEVDEFVQATSGKNLSTRNLDLLARAYFQGGEHLREQIKNGNFGWTLDQLKRIEEHSGPDSSELNEQEKGLIRDLEIAQKYQGKIIYRSIDNRLTNSAFFAEAELLTGGITRNLIAYQESIRRLNDQCREAKSRLGSIPGGKSEERDRQTTGDRPADCPPNH